MNRIIAIKKLSNGRFAAKKDNGLFNLILCWYAGGERYFDSDTGIFVHYDCNVDSYAFIHVRATRTDSYSFAINLGNSYLSSEISDAIIFADSLIEKGLNA